MEIISVPPTPKRAYNPKRPVSQLIRAHLHLAENAAKVPHERKLAHAIATEGDAARYLSELTAAVHPRLAPAPSRTPKRTRKRSARPAARKQTRKKSRKAAARTARRPSKSTRKAAKKPARKPARKPTRGRRRARR